MTFSARQCQARSKSSRRRCRQPALEGSDFCRMHADSGVKSAGTQGDEGAGQDGAPRKEAPEKQMPAKVGAPEGNANALRHGAYSVRLLPEEEPLYEEKRKAFTQALGAVDVFDEQIVHLLSLISVKVDQAVMKGAEHAAYGGMIKQILDLMKELKATRASRDPVEAGAALTFADLLEALKRHMDEAGKTATASGDSDKVSETVERHCARCGFMMAHETLADGRTRCTNCGCWTEPNPETEPPYDSPGDEANGNEVVEATDATPVENR